MLYLGGGFGWSGETDFIAQTAAIAREAGGGPVWAFWTYEQGPMHDFFRPASAARLRDGPDAKGRPGHLGVAQRRTGDDASDRRAQAGRARACPGGAASVAAAARRALPAPAQAGHRTSAVGEPLANGTDGTKRSRGGALHRSSGSVAAQVAEVSVGADKAVRMHGVVSVIDCGIAANPNLTRQQTESGSACAACRSGWPDRFEPAGVAQGAQRPRSGTSAWVGSIRLDKLHHQRPPQGAPTKETPCTDK